MRYLNQAIVEGVLTSDSNEKGFTLKIIVDDRMHFVIVRWGDLPHDSLREGDVVRVTGRICSENWLDGRDFQWRIDIYIFADKIEKI